MAKKGKQHEVDFDDYEEKEGSGYDGDQPLKGTFDGNLISLKEHTSGEGNEGYEWIFEITEEPFAGWRGWVYSNMDSSKWKTQQIVKAIQGGSETKVVLDPTDDGTDSKTVKKAKSVRLRMRKEKFEGEDRGKIARVMTSEGGDKKKKKGKKSKKTDDPF
jgi:hypothetical protein